MRQLNPNLIRLVDILNDGQYHDGTTIGQKLNITRSAIWKTIKRLRHYGIGIESVKGKGYRLEEPCFLLNKNIIHEQLTTKMDQSLQLTICESVDSTNSYLRQLPIDDNTHVCIAEHQTQGKGRLHRRWLTPFGKNIAFSMRYRFQQDISLLAGISLVCAIAVKNTLSTFGLSEKIKLKWPNDLLCDGKKIAGILIDVFAESHGSCFAVIGIGINVNMLACEDIHYSWTSLRQETNKIINRNTVCTTLIQELLTQITRFEKDGFDPFIDAWMSCDYLYNQMVTLNNHGTQVSGIANGINNQGHLLIKQDSGTVKSFTSGDVNLVRLIPDTSSSL